MSGTGTLPASGPVAWADVPTNRRGEPTEGRDPAHPFAGQGGMIPGPALLPDVLPTERLTRTGRPSVELRAELRRSHNLRNAANIVSVWVQSFGVIALACWLTCSFVLCWLALSFSRSLMLVLLFLDIL